MPSKPPPLVPPVKPLSSKPPTASKPTSATVSASKPSASKPAASAPEQPARRPGKLRWLLGWVVTPLLLLGMLFLAGVHVGARYPQMWLSRTTLWMFDREPQLGPTTDEEREPMARRLRLAVLPSKDHSFEVDVTEAELDKIAKDAGLAPAKLDCETVCKALWIEKHPELEFLGASHCKLTEPAEVTPPAKPGPAKLECDAKVQR